MRKLHLKVTLRTKRGPVTALAESNATWERQPNGDYLVRPQGESVEFLMPAASVKYEERARTESTTNGNQPVKKP